MMKRAIALGLLSLSTASASPSFLQLAAKKGDGFDGFGAPDPFNQNDDDQVDQGEPNAPDAENPNEDANMVTEDEANEDDDSFMQLSSKAKRGDGFDGFGAPDPFNQNDDDQVDQGEPNAPDAENPNEDANMVTEDEANEDDDSFVQLSSKAKRGDGFDGFGAPDPFNQNDDDQVDQGEPNAPDAENPNEDANMVTEDEANEDDDSFVQLSSKAKRGDGFDGFGAPDPFNQNDDDQVDQGEPNAPDTENPNEDANMVTEDEANEDDDSFVQLSSKAKRGDGFDGFGAPDPFNQNDDDQVDQGEPNAPDAENPNEDANMVTEDEANEDDDSFIQLSSKAKKGDGFDGFGAPDPFNQNDDDQVDQGEPNAPDAENPNEDANMVTEDEANEDDE